MHKYFFPAGGLLASILLVCGPSMASVDANWPTPPKLSELATPYGTLAVGASEYVYESRLQLDGTQIEPLISGMLNISYVFSIPDAQAALVTISKGNDTCPVSYRWVVLKADGYHVSPEFGSCSENIKVSAKARTLKVLTPSREAPDMLDVYEFDGERIRHRTSKRSKK